MELKLCLILRLQSMVLGKLTQSKKYKSILQFVILHLAKHYGELKPEQPQLRIVIFHVPSIEWALKSSPQSLLAAMVNQHTKTLAISMVPVILLLRTVQELLYEIKLLINL